MISCHRLELLRALKLATQIAGNGRTLPIVANVVLRADGSGKLEILATDIRVSMRAYVPCTIGDSLSVMIDARKLHETVSNLTADDVSIAVDDKRWTTLKGGKVTFKLAGQPDSNFPAIPSPTGAATRIETAVFREMISKTWFAASDDESRPNFSGIYLHGDELKLTATATDGYRICRLSRQLGTPKMQVIVPCLETLRSTLGQARTCTINISDKHVFITQESTTISIALVDLAYPNVDPVFTIERNSRATMSREALLIAMKRAGVMSTELSAAKLEFSNSKASLSVVNPDLGEVREDLEVEYGADPIAIGFNPKYVVELLMQMSSDRIVLEMSSPLDPALFRQVGSDDYAGIVLPMRV